MVHGASIHHKSPQNETSDRIFRYISLSYRNSWIRDRLANMSFFGIVASCKDSITRGYFLMLLELHTCAQRPIDRQICSRDEARSLTGQEYDRVGNLLGLAHSTKRVCS